MSRSLAQAEWQTCWHQSGEKRCSQGWREALGKAAAARRPARLCRSDWRGGAARHERQTAAVCESAAPGRPVCGERRCGGPACAAWHHPEQEASGARERGGLLRIRTTATVPVAPPPPPTPSPPPPVVRQNGNYQSSSVTPPQQYEAPRRMKERSCHHQKEAHA
ncbi:hypothetical protein AAFF_G00025640 [Aldrovandia affinis]|uniref:Uncharacterized protein n=1 Tax=Aldrovandia affinis TaxID=143900 RepID=A0AAD7S4Y4_9TELE|nr:hypothetical protein AAFF_G00025640 [Aldrovandia affinis]